MTAKLAPPIMALRLAADLDRFASKLLPYAMASGDRLALAMLECCDLLVIEGIRQRLERGRNE